MAEGSALVLFSGGQDSTVCLAWALERYARVETIGFAYGQRHAVELDQRPVILAAICRAASRAWARPPRRRPRAAARRRSAQISDTALTRDAAFEMTAAGLPNTFVPGRNLLFFTYAAALAYRRGIRTLVGGMCETDFSGYPDCRNDTLQSARQSPLARHGHAVRHRDAADVDRQGRHLGRWPRRSAAAPLVDLIVEHTHTCYTPDRTTRHAWGFGCGTCPACDLRAKGWERMADRQELTRAVDLALAGDWDGAHKIVQEDEDDATSCWIHAVPAQDRGRRRQRPLLVSPRRPSLRGLPRRQRRTHRHQGRADLLTADTLARASLGKF